MTIAILVDENLLPEKGTVELNVSRTFQINITADEARCQIHSWLIDEISSNIGAEIPTLVLGERAVWRVPAWLSFPRYGRVGAVGAVDVDVETGKMVNLPQCKAEIESCAEELVQRLPLYQPRQIMPPELLHTNFPAVPKLHLEEDELLPAGELAEDPMPETIG
jgi:hypothetical protein